MKSTWPGRVDQVELVDLAVVGPVVQADGVGLDGDAALALQVHGVEDLLHHFALRQRAGDFQQAVGQRGFAVVDVRDDGEIADEFADPCGMMRLKTVLSQMAYSHITFIVEGDGIALVTVSRPEKLNALNAATMAELDDAFARCERMAGFAD